MTGASQNIGSSRRTAITIVALVVLLSAVPSVALAETRAGGSVVVAEGETVDDSLEAFGGSIDIRGTVDGDVSAVGGTVRIDGTVRGDVSVTAGSVVIGPDATITGSLQGAAGTVVLAGTVEGDVQVGADSIELAETATVGGDLEYDGTLERAEQATVGGEVLESDDVGFGPSLGVSIPAWLPAAYFFAAGLLAALLCLALFPDFSTSVADGVAADPLRSGGAGLLVLLGVPVALVVLAITVVGIPLAVVGTFTYVFFLWIGSLYGRYAVGEYVLSLADVENRWLALFVGFLAVTAIVRIPLVGGFLQLIVLVLGLGSLAEELYRRYRGRDTGSNGQPERERAVADGTENAPA